MTGNPLRIAMVAPPWYPVPPVGYGGIELVVYLLTNELLAMGHDVTLYAAEGSAAGLPTVISAPAAWSRDLGQRDHRLREATYMSRVYRDIRSRDYDVVHEHSDAIGLLMGANLPVDCPVVATTHMDMTSAQQTLLGELDDDLGLVAISRSQRGQAPGLRWLGVVHNAVDVESLSEPQPPERYLLQLARICPDKGQHHAIEVARRMRLPLVLAGKIEEDSRDYFVREVQPHLGHGVTWLPDVSGKAKADLLARALAMVFPIEWEEPFGLAMVEAMVSGTPVVAFSRGAVPELVEDGVSGFRVADIDEMVGALGRVGEIDRERCARVTRAKFSPRAMALAYEQCYRRAAAQLDSPTLRLPASGAPDADGYIGAKL